MQRRGVDQPAQVVAQRRQGVVTLDRAQHVERDDVAGAFPDRAEVGVTHQPGVAPFLDVAAAAAHLHRVAGDLAGVAAGAELDQRRQDAHQSVGSAIGAADGVRLAQRLGGLQQHGARLLGGQQQLQQLAAHQRQVDQAFAESLALLRDIQRLAIRPAHQPGRTHAVGQARVVDHVGHLLEAAAGFADQPGARAFEPDLAAGHRPRAQLVLQPQDAEGVGRAVAQRARQQEQRDALHASRRAIDARQHHRQAGVGVGAKPLVAPQAVAAVGIAVSVACAGACSAAQRLGARGGGRHVRAGALFGHEHRALAQLVDILRGQPRQVALHQGGRAELAQRARQRIGHRQRAAQPELGLHEQIGQRVLGRRRHGLRPAQHARAVRHCRQPVLAEGDALQLDISRVLDDALRIQPAAGAVFQRRRMLVGRQGQAVEHTAGQPAQVLQVRQQVGVQVGTEVQRQQGLQLGIGVEQVGAVSIGHRVDRVGHGRVSRRGSSIGSLPRDVQPVLASIVLSGFLRLVADFQRLLCA